MSCLAILTLSHHSISRSVRTNIQTLEPSILSYTDSCNVWVISALLRKGLMGRTREGRFYTLLPFFAFPSAVLTKSNNQAIYTGTTDNEYTLSIPDLLCILIPDGYPEVYLLSQHLSEL